MTGKSLLEVNAIYRFKELIDGKISEKNSVPFLFFDEGGAGECIYFEYCPKKSCNQIKKDEICWSFNKSLYTYSLLGNL